MVPQPWVRVIIVNFNGGSLLQECVDGLAHQDFPEFEAVIVDNASSDGSIGALVLPDTRFVVVQAGANLGFAAGNNLGAHGCRSPWIATLNPDAIPERDWLVEWKAAVERHPDAALFGCTQLDAGDTSRLDGCGDVLSVCGLPWRGGYGHPATSLPPEGEVFAPCAAGALYRTDAFMESGGFDEHFFCYVEDVDLAFRLRLAGHRCIQVRNAVIRHHGSAITGRDSDFTLFHSYRNRIWMILKDAPGPLLPLMALLHVAAIAYLFVSDGRNRSARLRGLCAAWRDLPRVLAARRLIQANRRISTRAMAAMLAWRVSDMRRRAPVVRPL